MASDFDSLHPEKILAALEVAGYHPTGEYAQLNSYENRVFDVKLEVNRLALHPTERIIAKFYRPRRWSLEAIKDEHDFLKDLQNEGIPAIAPLPLRNGETLLEFEGFYLAVFPKVLGRNPQEFLNGELRQVGRTLARIHNVGARRAAEFRPVLGPDYSGWQVLPRLEQWVYPELWRAYQEAAGTILEYLEDYLDPSQNIRIHGDCHKGNLLHNGYEFFFVDFDDFVNGPAIQDFWMLFSGSDEDADEEREQLMEGYEELREFPHDDWHLVEPLRGLRIISYAGWIAMRWQDPFFKRIFPDFTTYNYWLEELTILQKIAKSLL